MKKLSACILTLFALALLTGCQIEVPGWAKPEETTAPTPETTIPAQPTETAAPTDVPTQPSEEVPATVPGETEGEDSSLPYLLKIDRADQSIFEGPGYDYVFVGTVREKGTYTIVEEVLDYEGNLWGKLKSGAGWVDLTEIRSPEYANALISANFADDNLILHGDYHYCPGELSEYRIPIAIRAYGSLRNVELCGFDFVGDDFVMGEAFFTLAEMDEERPLVAELAFPGDMSMYGIRFTDEAGNTYVYSIYISGRNGALVLSEYD